MPTRDEILEEFVFDEVIGWSHADLVKPDGTVIPGSAPCAYCPTTTHLDPRVHCASGGSVDFSNTWRSFNDKILAGDHIPNDLMTEYGRYQYHVEQAGLGLRRAVEAEERLITKSSPKERDSVLATEMQSVRRLLMLDIDMRLAHMTHAPIDVPTYRRQLRSALPDYEHDPFSYTSMASALRVLPEARTTKSKPEEKSASYFVKRYNEGKLFNLSDSRAAAVAAADAGPPSFLASRTASGAPTPRKRRPTGPLAPPQVGSSHSQPPVPVSSAPSPSGRMGPVPRPPSPVRRRTPPGSVPGITREEIMNYPKEYARIAAEQAAAEPAADESSSDDDDVQITSPSARAEAPAPRQSGPTWFSDDSPSTRVLFGHPQRPFTSSANEPMFRPLRESSGPSMAGPSSSAAPRSGPSLPIAGLNNLTWPANVLRSGNGQVSQPSSMPSQFPTVSPNTRRPESDKGKGPATWGFGNVPPATVPQRSPFSLPHRSPFATPQQSTSAATQPFSSATVRQPTFNAPSQQAGLGAPAVPPTTPAAPLRLPNPDVSTATASHEKAPTTSAVHEEGESPSTQRPKRGRGRPPKSTPSKRGRRQ
ncbi:hypothetical protein F4779DRAFT_620335 [Xylariaceae sp. FL0662B]|nr:hypothetical protein F4779DRAFT_620335 [Xylariaceae sp. FL0662B]